MLDDSILIFNHIPKAGGTSLIRFFEELYGNEYCYRHSARDPRTNTHTPPIDKLAPSERNKLKFLAGHFKYGKHKLFQKPYKYICVLRDPLERVVSDYYFNRESGRPDLQKIAMNHSLEEYIVMKMENPKSEMGRSAQIEYICGSQDLEVAMKILEQEYLLACTTTQLNEAMQRISEFFGVPHLEPKQANVTKKKGKSSIISDALAEEFKFRTSLDYKLFDIVATNFDSQKMEF
jgi:hypothetical protein